MSTDSPEVSRSLPVRSNLRHLKNQAKDLLKAGDAASIAEAQFKIARLYGFASWPKRERGWGTRAIEMTSTPRCRL